MAEPVYLLDFRRMTVEKIANPQPPCGIDTAARELPGGARQAGLTFATRASEPVNEEQE
jgi:hypothetical protein